MTLFEQTPVRLENTILQLASFLGITTRDAEEIVIRQVFMWITGMMEIPEEILCEGEREQCNCTSEDRTS